MYILAGNTNIRIILLGMLKMDLVTSEIIPTANSISIIPTIILTVCG